MGGWRGGRGEWCVCCVFWVVRGKNPRGRADYFLLARQLKISSYHLCSKCRVRFDSEVHLGEMDKKVHLSEMDSPYVGIRKNHTDIFEMDKKVHLGEMDFFVHFEKVGPFGTSISYLNCRIVIFTTLRQYVPTHHNPQPAFHPTPKAATHTPQNTLRNFPLNSLTAIRVLADSDGIKKLPPRRICT